MDNSKPFHYVVLIETASNQRTIFQTNRLLENIGASQLIYRVGKEFVNDVVEELGPEAAEIVVSASGKAILLARDEEAAKGIIQRVTLRTLDECPGVIARGAYVEIGDWTAKALDKAIQGVHRLLNDVASRLPPPVARFQRLPFVENCASSGYPASAINAAARKTPASSEVILARRRKEVVEAARQRIGNFRDFKLYRSLEKFEEASENNEIGDWIAIVHADGNGLGQVFLSFLDRVSKDATAEDYVDALKSFSAAIDDWSRTAAGIAIKETWSDLVASDDPGDGKGKRNKKQNFAPVAPVVLGGDDLTVICEGERAVRFAAAYLREFEKASREGLAKLKDKLPRIGMDFVAAAAGVAIVKPHFPFHRAYELVEHLIKSAKTSKLRFGTAPCSALDFHVVFDTSGGELEPIRDRMVVEGSLEKLTMRPYVVTPLDRLREPPEGDGGAMDWAKRRHYSEGDRSLQKAIEALLATPQEDSERADPSRLPRSQAHALHEALYSGRTVADGRLAQIRHRYPDFPWRRLTDDSSGNPSLFVEDGKRKGDDGKDHPQYGAYLLDAMELADLAGKDALDKEAVGARS